MLVVIMLTFYGFSYSELIKHVLGIERISASQMEASDVNVHGNVYIQDNALIAQRALRINDDFDDETNIIV